MLVGTPFDKLPAWIANWSRVDPTLLSVVDINKDGIFQLGEMKIGGDIIVLATPVFFALIALEYAIGRRRRQALDKPAQSVRETARGTCDGPVALTRVEC